MAGFSDEQIEDLKQLFAANNGALLKEIDQRFEKVEAKFDDLHAFVADAITTSNDVNGEDIADLKRRVTKLEQAAA